jgi:predicted acyl esterase
MTRSSSSRRGLLTATALLTFGSGVYAQTPPLTPDIPAKYEAPTASYDYVKRDVMIPMRDGMKLHTVIVVPKGAKGAPIILTRTP